jgi:FkbM family methyltransferase
MNNAQSDLNVLNYIRKQNKVIIWGTAFLGKLVGRRLYENGINISMFWDRTAANDSTCNINGKEIIVNKPYTSNDKEGTLIVICIGNNIIRNKLSEELKSQGYDKILSDEKHRELFEMVLDDDNEYLCKKPDNLMELSLKRRLEMAVDYAIETEYKVWERQYAAREWTRIAHSVCLYGVDEYISSDFFVEYCNNNGLTNVKYLCDNDHEKWGKTYRGIKCISPNELYELKACVVIILSKNEENIGNRLNRNKIKNYSINYLELNVFDNQYDREWFVKEKNNILETINVFEDEISKNIYVETICNRIAPHLALKNYNELESQGEYFAHGLFELSDNEYLVDAGAYIGDSLDEFMKIVNKQYGSVYLFELDKDNFSILCKKITNLALERIYPINKGVYSENERIEYSGSSGGANISENSGKYAEVVKLDDELSGKRVTFIKMDIEGSEMDALKGAESIIKEQKPKLAISVYHHLSDIWKVPMYIKSISKSADYKICLRHHSRFVWDTDCYFFE